MREILFRGQAANRIEGRAYRTNYKNGDWVYGLLTEDENYAGFSEMTNTIGVSGIEVDKNTVGQYTGMTDIGDQRIFEGDIMKTAVTGLTQHTGVVEFSDGSFGLRCTDGAAFFLCFVAGSFTIIGNIHDNPDLLEVN